MSNSNENTNNEKFESIAERPRMELDFNGEMHPIISPDELAKWDSAVSEFRQYVMDNKDGENLTSEQKDAIYAKGQEMWSVSFGKEGMFNNIKYNLILTREQYQLMTSLLRDKMEYDVNTLFFAMELLTFMASELADENAGKFKDDVTPKGFPISQTDMTLLYTLLSTHKCKGLGKQTMQFAEIIRRIGDISKVINHMENENQNLSKLLMDTVTLWEDGVVEDSAIKQGDVA